MNKIKDTYDWPGEWFRATEDCGDSVSIVYGHLKDDSTQPDWYELPHYDYDGIGGFVHLLRNQGHQIDELPAMKGDSYSFFRILRGMLAYIPTASVRKQEWLRFSPKDKNIVPPVNERVFWHLFSKEETIKISQAAKTAGVTVNTYLLYHLDIAAATQLMPASASRRWMIPVNIRGAVTRPLERQVHNSFLAVDLKGDLSMNQLNKKIIQLKKKGFHWGAWFGFQSASKMGKEGVRKYLISRREKGDCWTGTFSNLGVWKVPNSGKWVFCTTAPQIYPIGASCITMNEQLAISLQMHSAFGEDPKLRQALLDEWKQACLKG